ncbi:MAG: 30S ribosome-binding factor RbfA [Chlamydiales bacterium]
MPGKRTDRLNSLLREVISEVIRRDVKNPHVSPLTSITRVEITKDLHYAKVMVSVIGDEKVRNETVKALNSASGFIGSTASKKVVLRFFPKLSFHLDDSIDKHMRIEELLKEIHKKND